MEAIPIVLLSEKMPISTLSSQKLLKFAAKVAAVILTKVTQLGTVRVPTMIQLTPKMCVRSSLLGVEKLVIFI